MLTLTSLALLAVSVHRMIVWHDDVNNPTGALLETKIITPQQWVGHLESIADVTFWLFWPMVASNVLWITGGLLLLRRTRSGESASKDKAERAKALREESLEHKKTSEKTAEAALAEAKVQEEKAKEASALADQAVKQAQEAKQKETDSLPERA